MAHKSSFTRVLRPSLLNPYLIEMFVCILLTFIFMIGSIQKSAFFHTLKFGLLDTTKPIVYSIAMPFEILNNLLLFAKDVSNVYDRNNFLESENQKFQKLLSKNSSLEIENSRLKKILNIKDSSYSKRLIARVLIDPYARPNASIFIDLGKEDGLKINDIVFNDKGMIGRIEELGKKSAKVLTVFNQNSVIPVISLQSKKSFFVQGDGNSLKIKHLENPGNLINDEMVVSTDAAGYFKEGIIVGRIVKKFEEIYVEPFAKKSDSIYVSVLVYDFKDLTDW